jgi:hypothetical protein
MPHNGVYGMGNSECALNEGWDNIVAQSVRPDQVHQEKGFLLMLALYKQHTLSGMQVFN